MASVTKKHFRNTLLIIIIIVLALFILLAPRKKTSPFSSNKDLNIKPTSSIYDDNYGPVYVSQNPGNFQQPLIGPDLTNEQNKHNYIMHLNNEYTSRGYQNDLINLMNLPTPPQMTIGNSKLHPF